MDNITNAIGHHKPIGHLFLKGGLSFGGTCFPRDTKAFIKFSESVGHNASHIIATDDINKKQDLNLSKIVNTIDKESISVLGLSFKPNTPVLTESPSIKLVKQLLIKGKTVNVYDSLCIDDVKDEFSGWPYSNMRDKIKINYFKSIKECFQAGELVIIALPSDEFTIINDDWKSFDDQVILDCWRILDSNNFKQIQYKCLGKRG